MSDTGTLDEYIIELELDLDQGFITQEEFDERMDAIGYEDELLSEEAFEVPSSDLDIDYISIADLTAIEKDSLMHLQELFYRQCMHRSPDEEIKKDVETVLYAKEGERMVAGVWYEVGDHSIYLAQVYVHPEYRISGLAKGLIRKLIEDNESLIGEEGIQSVFASSVSEALPFYDAIGFQEFGDRQIYKFEGTGKVIEDQHVALPFTVHACRGYGFEVPSDFSFDSQMASLRR